MKNRAIAMLAVVAFLVTGVVVAEKADSKKVNLTGMKWMVSGKPAKDVGGSSVAYKGGKVYLCCAGCPAAFKKNTEKFAAKANFQLFATKQAKAVKCVFSGRDLNAAQTVNIEGKDVAFCCAGCKGKVSKAEDKVALVFSDAAFAKGFKVGAKKKK